MYRIDLKSDIPLYIQIVEETKKAIFLGFFKEGDKIPSIRDLSKDLLVNQSTVSKAYKELEAQGFIQTVSGRGTFIHLDWGKIENQKDEVYKKLKAVFKEALAYGIGWDEIGNIYEEIDKEVRI